jgi:hypothetical protein
MAKRGRGRPTLFTKARRNKIIKAIAAGNYREVAAQTAGIDKATLRGWMRRGRLEKKGDYFSFFTAVMEAENKAESVAVQAVRLAGKDDVKHFQWWLERKCPERWGRDTFQIKQLQAEFEKMKAEFRVANASQKVQAIQSGTQQVQSEPT